MTDGAAGELEEQLELRAAEMDRGAGGGGAAGGEVDVDVGQDGDIAGERVGEERRWRRLCRARPVHAIRRFP